MQLDDYPFQNNKEWKEKLAAAKKDFMDSRKDEMMYLSEIATKPSYQGHGYGGALLERVNEFVSARFRCL